jgi:hypothetical protein
MGSILHGLIISKRQSVVNKELAAILLSLNHMNTLKLVQTLSFLSYGLLLAALIKAPESFWDAILRLLDRLGSFGANQKKKLPFIGEIYHGEALLLSLQAAEAKISLGLKMLPSGLNQYKFYTDLLDQLFESNRRLGIGLKKFIPEIRKVLQKDLQFEKKVLNECIGALLQFAVIAGTTWGFVLISGSLVQLSPPLTIVGVMILLEILGVFLFFRLLRKLKRKMFAPFSEAIKELYLFSTLIEVGLPLNEILERSQIINGSLVKEQAFFHEGIRTKKLIERLKTNGLSPLAEIQEIISSLWHLQEENFNKFTKKVQVLKFAILACFFLPAYFLYLYSIFQFFMEQ